MPPMMAIVAGSATELRFVHPLKALAPMLDADSSIVTDIRNVQFWKAASPIGALIVTDISFVQFWKAALPIVAQAGMTRCPMSSTLAQVSGGGKGGGDGGGGDGGDEGGGASQTVAFNPGRSG